MRYQVSGEGTDMANPYTSSRTGTTQWLLQRVSAVLLLGLAFSHFAMQHFTTDAVSTGLTVAHRANNAWWQGYYIIFVVLALYHGINGLIGIIRDYRPRPWLRGVMEWSLWALALYFAVVGSMNFTNATPVGAVKEFYAVNGFPSGSSAGHPRGLQGEIHYDFRNELRELHLLAFYLEKHTARTDDTTLEAIFAHTRSGKGAPTADEISAAGASFDAWVLRKIAQPQPAPEKRDPERIFSSSREFAIWSAHVRQANSRFRDGDDSVVVARYATGSVPVPPYRAADLH